MAKTPTDNTGNPKTVHPLYAQWAPTWQKAYDVYEGAGGFLDPACPYLYAHPREWLDHSIPVENEEGQTIGHKPNPNPQQPSPKLQMRRKLARYENVAAIILDTFTGALFTELPTRKFKTDTPELFAKWQANVDGKGTQYDLVLQQAWNVSGVFSHSILLMDKSSEVVASAADQKLPRLVRYSPLDLIDWIEDEQGKVTSVKLLEAAPRKDFTARHKSTDVRVRVVDEEKWTIYEDNKVVDQGEHGFGCLPVAFLYAKRRTLTPIVGKSIMGDPKLFIDLYNLVSEARELLRNQTFAILNIPIGKDGDVERERSVMGSQSGTSNVLLSTNAAGYISPGAENVTAYHEHMDRLTKMVYRLSAVPYDNDSRDAESAESRKAKRADMTSVLLKCTAELQQTDRTILELFYRAVHGADGWEKAWEKDAPSVSYPQVFELPDIEAVAARAGELLGLELGETASQEIKKRTVRAALPNLSADQQKAIDEEIEEIPIQTAQEKQEQMFKNASARMAGRGFGEKGPKPKEEPTPEPEDDEKEAA